jgi:hypothetical protein
MSHLPSAVFAASLAVTLSASAEDTGVFSKGIPSATFDNIWSAGTLYKDNSNPILEEFDFIGRYQMDYFNVDSDKGDKDYTEIRRFRLGADAFFFDRHAALLRQGLRVLQPDDQPLPECPRG